jgi:signal transduction histidine kinase
VEITKKHKEKLLSLLLINFVVLILINLVGSGLGILLIIGYTVLLFNYGVELLEKVRALNAASRQLSTGNFDVTLPEDMGILSSFAKNLNNIKEGFKVAVEQEVKSQNMKTQLISNVSHDLKTPLTSIITYVDLLKKEDIDQETLREYIDILDRKSKRLQVLIDDLFEASKASTGDIELHLENLDVVALLRQTLGEMEEKINQSTLKIRVNLPDHKIICNLDGARTYRVFENILSNILKYSLQNTRVYIDAVEDEKNVSLIFKNISAYEMNFDPSEITERFMRADQSRNTEGSGLGLAISKSLVELQDGTIDIDIDGDLFKLTVTFPKI